MLGRAPLRNLFRNQEQMRGDLQAQDFVLFLFLVFWFVFILPGSVLQSLCLQKTHPLRRASTGSQKCGLGSSQAFKRAE